VSRPSLVTSMTVVNAPFTGSDRVMVTGYGVTDPVAQSGSQLCSFLVPCPTAVVAPQDVHVRP
jgi:hypothetical protein